MRLFKYLFFPITLVLISFSFFSKFYNNPSLKKVAITQIVPHPSLAEIRKGITDVLLETFPDKTLDIIFEDAQGNMTIAAQIAQRFLSLDPDVIVPITTPSAQSVANLIKKKPIIFAGISNPVTAKLLTSLEEAHNNITGVCDKPPLSQQFDLMVELLNKQGKPFVLGVIYNPGESNSLSIIKDLKVLSEEKKVKLAEATANNILQVSSAVLSLVGKVHAIYLPNDNTIISALNSILKVVKKEKIPLFTADPESVKKGALATISPDQYQMGRQAGELIIKSLKGYPLKKIPPEIASRHSLLINANTAFYLGLSIPQKFLKKAQIIKKNEE